jgi:hypothetical protein
MPWLFFEEGAVPVKAAIGEAGWVAETAYQGSHEAVANQIVSEWRDHKLVLKLAAVMRLDINGLRYVYLNELVK